MMLLPAAVALMCALQQAANSPAAETALQQPPQAPVPRIALLYSDYGNFRHRDDYDATMQQLGWPMDKYENTQLPQLVRNLSRYDIILGSALYNYSHEQDISRWWSQLRTFIRRGGAIVLTDVNYAQHVRWLSNLGPEWVVKVENCRSSGKPATLTRPDFFLCRGIRLRAIWAHMLPGRAWTILARCPCGAAIWAIRGEEAGFIWLSSFWPLSPDMLRRIWAYLRLRRAGLADFQLHAPATSTLTHTIRLSFVPLASGRWRAKVELRAPSKPPAAAETFIRAFTGRRASARLTLHLPARGRYAALLALTSPTGAVFSHGWVATVPELMQARLIEPAYRGAIYLSLPSPYCLVRVTAFPISEDLSRAALVWRAFQGARQRAQGRASPPKRFGQHADVRCPLPNLRPGTVRLHLALRQPGRTLWQAAFDLPVIPARPGQAVIGPARQTFVDGKPFFPIGIYHIKPEFLDKARQMGFNCMQAWGTNVGGARRALDTAAAHGMKVILEMSALLRGTYKPDQFRAIVEACRDHPALLCWYPVDEPGPGQFDWCMNAYRICRELDPNHPVYLVMCDPRRFEWFARATDILAIDPYPVPEAPLSTVWRWMQQAQEAVAGGKPVWLIPQLHNKAAYRDPSRGRGPTPQEEWCMVFQGLIAGAKGIVYYPWDDGPCGLVHSQQLMAEVPKINAFLQRWGPTIAGSEPQRLGVVASEDAANEVYAAAFKVGERQFLVLATNAGSKPAAIRINLRELAPRASARSATHIVGERPTLRGSLATLTLPPAGISAFLIGH